MSQKTRPTALSSGRQGRILNVFASGIAIMSDSSIALKPVIDEPSKPMPPSKASSSSSLLIEKLFSWPRMSVNQKRMKRMLRSSTMALTSSAVFGWSAIGLLLHGFGSAQANRGGAAVWPNAYGRRVLLRRQVLVRPLLEGAQGRLERLALRREAVLHADRGAVEHAALDDALPLELLQPLGEQPVGELGHELADAGEVKRAVHEDEQNRAGPALADQLDGAVVEAAARRTVGVDSFRCSSPRPIGVCQGGGHVNSVVGPAGGERDQAAC